MARRRNRHTTRLVAPSALSLPYGCSLVPCPCRMAVRSSLPTDHCPEPAAHNHRATTLNQCRSVVTQRYRTIGAINTSSASHLSNDFVLLPFSLLLRIVILFFRLNRPSADIFVQISVHADLTGT